MFVINKRTPLKTIISFAARDFGIALNNADAKEIREDVATGRAVWTRRSYKSVAQSSEIAHMSRAGIRTNTGAGYTRDEWNATR